MFQFLITQAFFIKLLNYNTGSRLFNKKQAYAKTPRVKQFVKAAQVASDNIQPNI